MLALRRRLAPKDAQLAALRSPSSRAPLRAPRRSFLGWRKCAAAELLKAPRRGQVFLRMLIHGTNSNARGSPAPAMARKAVNVHVATTLCLGGTLALLASTLLAPALRSSSPCTRHAALASLALTLQTPTPRLRPQLPASRVLRLPMSSGPEDQHALRCQSQAGWGHAEASASATFGRRVLHHLVPVNAALADLALILAAVSLSCSLAVSLLARPLGSFSCSSSSLPSTLPMYGIRSADPDAALGVLVAAPTPSTWQRQPRRSQHQEPPPRSLRRPGSTELARSIRTLRAWRPHGRSLSSQPPGCSCSPRTPPASAPAPSEQSLGFRWGRPRCGCARGHSRQVMRERSSDTHRLVRLRWCVGVELAVLGSSFYRRGCPLRTWLHTLLARALALLRRRRSAHCVNDVAAAATTMLPHCLFVLTLASPRQPGSPSCSSLFELALARRYQLNRFVRNLRSLERIGASPSPGVLRAFSPPDALGQCERRVGTASAPWLRQSRFSPGDSSPRESREALTFRSPIRAIHVVPAASSSPRMASPLDSAARALAKHLAGFAPCPCRHCAPPSSRVDAFSRRLLAGQTCPARRHETRAAHPPCYTHVDARHGRRDVHVTDQDWNQGTCEEANTSPKRFILPRTPPRYPRAPIWLFPRALALR
ncbi:hypothetical protein B0H15DRAFT_947204 [Mycena belliarum]|uniref:Uncharacterized protein n=1 Tax=Mycena belliarum TaxID=1033014 RepID=A0AAD6U893_9AGAR|nr:hypothetical protein B0H15DRAFT_947204 [Mycena belliae]